MEINAIQFFTLNGAKILGEEWLQIYLYPAVSKANRGNWLLVSTTMQILFLPYSYKIYKKYCKYKIIICTINFIQNKKRGRGLGTQTVKC